MSKAENKKKKKNLWMLLASLLIFAVGAGIFLYPAVSNYLAERNQRKVIRSYRAAVENQDQGTLDAAWAEAEEYNENLAGDPVHDPFVLGSGYVLPDNYQEVLNVNGDGVMGYIEIPKIGVYLPIYHGTSEETLQKGAGHLEATALPVGGLNRHPVISAHRGLPSAELFTRLDEMKIGDIFYIHVLDRTLAYQVDQIETIVPEDLAFLRAEEGKDLVTLLTCTPYAVNTHRLLVRGERIPYEEDAGLSETETVVEADHSWFKEYRLAIFLGLAALVILILAVLLGRRAVKRRKRRGRGKKG